MCSSIFFRFEKRNNLKMCSFQKDSIPPFIPSTSIISNIKYILN